jgi:uncharacterized membrane protein YfcA
MPDALTIPLMLLLIGTAFVASILGALSGFGVSVGLMPVLALALGERDAVPALTIATLVGNMSRVWFNRHTLRWSAAGWYLIGAAPAAAVGGFLFASAPERLLAALMAAFLLGAVVYRRHRRPSNSNQSDRRMPESRLAIVGSCTGIVSALVGGAGPIVVPFFLAAGLTKQAFIGTEALAAAGVHIVKLVAYGGMQAMTTAAVWSGAVVAPAIIVGSWIGKQIIDRVNEKTFMLIVEAMMVASAVALLCRSAGWLH